jgi:hypothetical protein
MGPGGFPGGGSVAHRADTIPNQSAYSAWQLQLVSLNKASGTSCVVSGRVGMCIEYVISILIVRTPYCMMPPVRHHEIL